MNRERESRRIQPAIGDLAVIGDRRTAAVLDRHGNIVWYCPERFDGPSLFAALLDSRGGAWRLALPDSRFGGRNYIAESGVLETRRRTALGEWRITDFMPAGDNVPRGMICRLFSRAPDDVMAAVDAPDYGRDPVRLSRDGDAVVINGTRRLYASHPLTIEVGRASFQLPKGDSGWAVLADEPPATAPARADLERWRDTALVHWRSLAAKLPYSGLYQREVLDSLRAIRLLRHDVSGGIVAAATTSLPEVAGGSSNWDYRYVWLRDAGMIVSALTRLGGDLTEGGATSNFCATRAAVRPVIRSPFSPR